MKWQCCILVLTFIRPCVSRGLKTPKAPEAFSLEAEIEALKKRNKHLEAMMQVARTEVQRMDAASRKHLEVHVEGGGKDTQEVDDLKKKLHAVEADKKSLMQTLRQLLAKNSTKIFRQQAEKQQALELKCTNDRIAFQAQIKQANGKCDETKELAQTLQEQNMDLQRTVQDLKAKFSKSEQAGKDLAVDKANLVATMHSLMRESSGYQKELKKEAEKENKLTQELAADEAKLAKAAKQGKGKPMAKTAKNARKAPLKDVKNAPMHLTHEESMASKMAKMTDINRYIDRADMPEIPDDSNDNAPEQASVAPTAFSSEKEMKEINKEVDAMQKQEDVFARNQVALEKSQGVTNAASQTPHGKAGLSDWLGLKVAPAKPAAEGAIPRDANGLSPIDALDPDAVKQEKASAAKKAKADADDGGDGIENLLAQAKDQLSAMDAAEAQTPA